MNILSRYIALFVYKALTKCNQLLCYLGNVKPSSSLA